ncbi:hypothetical protein [Salinibacterium sp. ZJ450]|uniref:hypothetical protein n=1 Tax=Salinibacterium sp. ZJ450 TaxID=2708338 RepID=UPI00141E8FAA|nr:hypothetical protein [Salinibacterium sp. ZJ450]
MISLFRFQEIAVAQISERVRLYLEDPVFGGRNKSKHQVPFFQALSALTGAGKTAILAAAVSRIASEMPTPPIVLWLSMRSAVVEQSYRNLAHGGKYHHLLEMPVAWLSEYSPDDVGGIETALMYCATVGTFAQRDREDGNLRIYKSNIDTMEQSTWTALMERLDHQRRRRPLIVVYDESQNLSDLQIDLLLDLEPDVFLPASATLRYPARLDRELDVLRAHEFTDDELVTRVVTKDVVDSELVKPQIVLEGYNSPMEEAVSALVASLRETEREAQELALEFRPKAIYVSDTNVVADNPGEMDDPRQPFDQRQAPPVKIWRYLTEKCGVDPSQIAVYANLNVDREYPLPEEFVLFQGGDGDYASFSEGSYQHVIFNLRLQEGWDDPSVYFAYIDKSMGSTVQVTQIIGRVLRQPGATHYSSELLNTAHFYVRVDKNEVFSGVISEVERELGSDPGGIKIITSSDRRTALESYPPLVDLYVPLTGIDSRQAIPLIQRRMENTPDFRLDTVNTRGTGAHRTVKQKVGSSAETEEWQTIEQSSSASVRYIFQRELQRQFKSVIGTINWADPKLDAVVDMGSPAYYTICELATNVVDDFTKGSRISQRKDNPYKAGTVLARRDEIVEYNNSVHRGYAGLNSEETRFALALDESGLRWARNPDRLGYGIDLVTPGPTQKFYPDFLLWTANRVVCIDTKGQHLVHETAKRKLLNTRYPGVGPRLDIQFVSLGQYNGKLEKRGSDGATAWGLGSDGNLVPVHYQELADVVKYLSDDSLRD